MKTLRIESGRKIGVTSDTHYRHRNIIKHCLRPFMPAQMVADIRDGKKVEVDNDMLDRHDSYIIAKTNELLGKDDILIHCGDVAWGAKALREYADKLNVRTVYCMIGNHDEEHELKWAFGEQNVFERVLFEFETPGGLRRAVADHYPGDSWRDSHKGCWQFFGHVHGNLDVERAKVNKWSQSLDVGVESHEYRPWDFHSELMPLLDRKRSQLAGEG